MNPTLDGKTVNLRISDDNQRQPYFFLSKQPVRVITVDQRVDG